MQIASSLAGLHETDPDVYYVDAPLIVVGPEHLAFLRERARASPRLRSRICAHPAPDSDVHEMLIAHHRTTYVRPHRHRGRSESLFVVEGEAVAIFLDDDGRLAGTLELGSTGSGKAFYYRVPASWWHTLVIHSEWLIFHEVVAGPFERSKTEFPLWAPDGKDAAGASAYREQLLEQLRR